MKGVVKHGLSRTRIYQTWADMKGRCLNPKHKEYHLYGGRGIKVCDDWKNDFMKFYVWAIQNGYDDKLQIDRINNDGNYEPKNCRWVTNKENSWNTRKTKITIEQAQEIRNAKLLLKEQFNRQEVAKAYGIVPETVSKIIHNRRWSLE